MNLLAAEITARTGAIRASIRRAHGAGRSVLHPHRRTGDARTKATGAALASRSRREPGRRTILLKLTHAPGNNAPIGGLKVVTTGGWFAARPSGTEAVCKVYAESFRDERHLQMLVSDAQRIVQGT